jgi:hypothetical protein
MATQVPVNLPPAQSRTYPPSLFFLAWALIAGLAVLSVAALRPPAPLAATAPASEFSAERAFAHVREIARTPHPIGSDANGAVRNYLLGQLSQLGVQASVFSAMGVAPAHPINSSARLVIGGKTQDVVGLLPGAGGGQAILLMAHYDSVPHADGAGDDAAAAAAILEIVRALRAGPALQRDLIVLFTDGEESGLLGAEAFVHGHPWAKNVGLALNFDARGDRGPSLLFETSANNAPLIDAVGRYAPHPVGSSFFYALYKLLPNDTDFTVLRPAGVPGLNFAFGEGLEAYHSPLDTPEHLSPGSLQHHGSYGLALVRHFGQLDLATLKSAGGDAIFFDWFGDRLISYRQSWVLPGEILVTVLLALALGMAFRARTARPGRLLAALGASLAVFIAVPVVAAAGWWVMALILNGRRIFSDSPANLCLLSGLMLLGAYAGTLLLAFFRRRLGLQELSLAALSLWCVLSWLLALTLPSGSYLLFWPLLLALAGTLSMHLFRAGSGAGPSLRSLPAIAAAILLFAPVVYLLYIFLTLQMVTVAAAAVLVGLFLLIAVPWEASYGVSSRMIAMVPGAGAAICLIAGMALSGHTPEHPRADSIVYSLNADENSAVWITYDRSADEWTRQFLTANPQGPQPQQKYLAGLDRAFLSAPAPVLPLLPPLLENLEHKQEGEVHRLKLRIRSQRNAGALYLRFPEGVQPVSVKAAGRDVPMQKGGRFGLTWFGLGNDALELELAVTGPADSVWLMDRSNSLPGDVTPRPANLTTQDGSDVAFVCRKFHL